jgi:hypothetical protein
MAFNEPIARTQLEVSSRSPRNAREPFHKVSLPDSLGPCPQEPQSLIIRAKARQRQRMTPLARLDPAAPALALHLKCCVCPVGILPVHPLLSPQPKAWNHQRSPHNSLLHSPGRQTTRTLEASLLSCTTSTLVYIITILGHHPFLGHRRFQNILSLPHRNRRTLRHSRVPLNLVLHNVQPQSCILLSLVRTADSTA